jgi:hypothetical protein
MIPCKKGLFFGQPGAETITNLAPQMESAATNLTDEEMSDTATTLITKTG